MPTRAQVETALAEKYTTGLQANPKFDRKKAKESGWEDDPDNPEYVELPMERRRQQSPWEVFRASDGMNAIRVPTIPELVEVLVVAGLVDG